MKEKPMRLHRTPTLWVAALAAALTGAPTAAAEGPLTAAQTQAGDPSPATRAAPLLAVGLKVGAAVPTSKLGATPWIGLDVELPLPMVAPFISLALEGLYAQPSLSGTLTSTAAAAPVAYTLEQRVLALALQALAQVPVGPVRAYGGLGWGVYSLRAKTTALGAAQTASQTRGGLQARAGAGYALGAGEAFGEVRYDWSLLRFTTTGESNAGAVALGFGYRAFF
jgi:hypothetical protein